MPIQDAPGARGRVLVVDDGPANLALLASLLQTAGHDVRIANAGRRALALIERQAPDLVLLDIELPDLNGFDVCSELKANPALNAIPVIFLSSHDDATTRGRAFEVGGADYLSKPFEAREVLARVGLHLELIQARRENAALRLALEQRGEG